MEGKEKGVIKDQISEVKRMWPNTLFYIKWDLPKIINKK